MTIVEMEINNLQYTENEKTVVEITAVTDKYVDPKLIPIFNKQAINMPGLYRHNGPSSGGEIVGRIMESAISKTTDGYNGLDIKIELLENTKYQRALKDYVKLRQKIGKPIGVSVGFQETRDSDGNVIDGQLYEVSFTHIPVCKDHCFAKGVYTVTNEDKTLEAQLDELQNLLDDKVSENKKLESTVTELEDKLEKEKEAHGNQLKALKKEMEEKIHAVAIGPIVSEICELEEEDDEEIIATMYTWTKEKALKRLERAKKKFGTAIVTETMEETADNARAGTSNVTLEDRLAYIDGLNIDQEEKNYLIKLERMKGA